MGLLTLTKDLTPKVFKRVVKINGQNYNEYFEVEPITIDRVNYSGSIAGFLVRNIETCHPIYVLDGEFYRCFCTCTQ